jgi:hypothetical protein
MQLRWVITKPARVAPPKAPVRMPIRWIPARKGQAIFRSKACGPDETAAIEQGDQPDPSAGSAGWGILGATEQWVRAAWELAKRGPCYYSEDVFWGRFEIRDLSPLRRSGSAPAVVYLRLNQILLIGLQIERE